MQSQYKKMREYLMNQGFSESLINIDEFLYKKQIKITGYDSFDDDMISINVRKLEGKIFLELEQCDDMIILSKDCNMTMIQHILSFFESDDISLLTESIGGAFQKTTDGNSVRYLRKFSCKEVSEIYLGIFKFNTEDYWMLYLTQESDEITLSKKATNKELSKILEVLSSLI